MRPGNRVLQATSFILLLFLSGVSAVQGQMVSIVPRASTAHAGELPRSTFRLDVKLVEIPVSVSDFHDHPIIDLAKSRFRVFEDGLEQQIVSFSRSDTPISTGLVFDTSNSMRRRIENSRMAVEQFLKTSCQGDEYSLVTFSDKPELVSRFTPDAGTIARRLSEVQPHGWTAMIDAIGRSLGEMRKASNPRKVLLVLTDGGDNNSRYSEGELFSIVRESDVRIYSIGLFERPKYLERLAEETGGSVVWVHKLSELPDAMQKLSNQIRNEYRLGYFSSRAQDDGRYHRVRVEVAPDPDGKKLRVSWRRGYTAP